MSVIGTPDFQYGQVVPIALLATVASGTATVTVELPANAISVSIIVPGGLTPIPLTCTGTTTGQQYMGGGMFNGGNGVGSDPVTTFNIAPAVDPSVTIACHSAPTKTWYVFSQAISPIVMETTLDSIIQPGGIPSPDEGILVAGQDNVAEIVRVLTTDTASRLIVVDTTLAAAIAALGTATPADAVLVAGSDGTDLRALKVDSTGALYTAGGGGAAAQALNAVLVANGYIALGSDGTDGRPLATDANGRAIPLVPTATTGLITSTGGNQTILAAPGSGANYLFGGEIQNTTATGVQAPSLTIGGAAIAAWELIGQVSLEFNLGGYRTTSAVVLNAPSTNNKVVLRYAPGP